MAKTECTGIVLTGGKSSRMGREKGLITWRGRSLAENAINILSSLCGELIISANSDHYNSLGLPVIADRYKDCGPIGGILSCLQQSKSDLNLVIPVDVPFLSPEVYLRLLKQSGDYDIIVPLDHESWYQPLCSVFNKSIIPVMEKQVSRGILGFTPLIHMVNSFEVPFSMGDDGYLEQTFFNINSPEDLKALY